MRSPEIQNCKFFNSRDAHEDDGDGDGGDDDDDDDDDDDGGGGGGPRQENTFLPDLYKYRGRRGMCIQKFT